MRRKGKDLFYSHTMTLKEAIGSAPVRFETLDARVLTINLDRAITP